MKFKFECVKYTSQQRQLNLYFRIWNLTIEKEKPRATPRRLQKFNTDNMWRQVKKYMIHPIFQVNQEMLFK